MAARFTVLVICGGMLACMARPLQAAHRTQSFADWLSSVVREADDQQVRRELNRLRQSRMDFSRVVSEASEIVTRNNEEFNLPLEESAAAAQVYHLLLAEWSHYQTGNAMSAVPLPDSGKLFGPQKTDQAPGFNLSAADRSTGLTASRHTGPDLLYADPLQVPAVEAMIHGIAIGAP
ncbi:MAG: hypothetical protein U5K31_10940 [Balneolaceae bacterium]|nr:hypothetical protein [Balneolaceae bacterium]